MIKALSRFTIKAALLIFSYFANANVFSQPNSGQLPQISGDLSKLIGEQHLHDPMTYGYTYKMQGEPISMDKVSGNPFNYNDYKPALLVGYGANQKWFCYAKINEVSGEVYFKDKKNNELSLDKGLIKKIIFYATDDTSKLDRVYLAEDSVLAKNNETGNPFLQLMNNGNYSLLKRTGKIVNIGDSLLGTLKRYYLSSYNKYYLLANQKIIPVAKMNKENICFALPNSKQCDKWISENKINFKKEEDVIRFIDYYNSLQQ